MPLTDLNCRQAKPKGKAFRLYDGGGLYLEIKPTGTKVWRLKFKHYDKEKLLTIGKYPTISLLDARNRQQEAKKQIEKGIDPAKKKQDEKKLFRFKQLQTFELVAREWHEKNIDTWTKDYSDEILRRLDYNVFPLFGKKPIAEIGIPDLLVCTQKMEERGANDLAHRVISIVRRILSYGVITGRIEFNCSTDLKGALKKYEKGHFAAIEVDELPSLLKAINENHPGLFRQTILALKLIMLTFVRTVELIDAQWDEFDLEKAVWKIPANRMKMKRPHIVPLSRQTLEILYELQEKFSSHGYILPSPVKKNQSISNNTILKALESLGYAGRMTGHGFRALAMSAIKEKLGYRHEVVDRQLAHLPKSKVDQAYDRATFMNERTIMMQEWGDFIDSLVETKFSTFKIKQNVSLISQTPQHTSGHHSFSMQSPWVLTYKV